MKTILVLTDFSDKGINASEYAFKLASTIGADLLLFNAYQVPKPAGIENSIYYLHSVDRAFKEESNYQLEVQADYLESLKRTSKADYLPKISTSNAQGLIAQHIEKLVDENDVGLVVMGEECPKTFSERILTKGLFESIIDKISCPVLLIGASTPFKSYKDVTFACGSLDFNHLKAIDYVTGIIEAFNPELDIVHITENFFTERNIVEESGYMQSISSFKSFINYENLTWHKLNEADANQILEKFAGFINADLICIIHQRHPVYKENYQKNFSPHFLSVHKKPLLIFPTHFIIKQTLMGDYLLNEKYAKL